VRRRPRNKSLKERFEKALHDTTRHGTAPEEIPVNSALDDALLTAIFARDLRRALLALAQGANIHATDKSTGWSPLHIAAARNETTTAAFLVLNQHRVDAISMCQLRRTPLHVAAAEGNTAICGWLYRKGASLAIRDSEGQTAVEVAVVQQNADCATLLRLAQLCDEESKHGGGGGRGKGTGEQHDTFMEALINFTASIEAEEIPAVRKEEASREELQKLNECWAASSSDDEP